MNTEWFGLLVAMATALGLRELIVKAIDWFGGRSLREKSRVREFIDERNAAQEEADCLRDYVSYYRAKIEDLDGGVVARPGWPCVPFKSNLLIEEDNGHRRSGGDHGGDVHGDSGPDPHRTQ